MAFIAYIILSILFTYPVAFSANMIPGDGAHIPQEDRSKYHHFSCHRFEILKSNVLIISEIFIKDILHFHDLAGYMLAHCTWHEHE